MITRINESKTLTNVNLMEENVTKINGGITINVDVSVKKKIIFGINLEKI